MSQTNLKGVHSLLYVSVGRVQAIVDQRQKYSHCGKTENAYSCRCVCNANVVGMDLTLTHVCKLQDAFISDIK